MRSCIILYKQIARVIIIPTDNEMASSERLIWVVVTFGCVFAYPRFQEQIPNGDNVPHSCKVNYIWHGVGHKNPMGGGSRNVFGADFAVSHTWTKDLCQKDSDGDGKTNGEELGDPNCEWTPGSTPKRVDHITHPGVCDPWGSPDCQAKNSWVDCSLGEFKCDAINEPDVFNITLRYPKTSVPNKETNYMCMNFRLPADMDYHLIATAPAIDNADVMHHMLLSGCNPGVPPTSEPYPCDMSAPGCSGTLGGWTVGRAGSCVNEHMGYKVGNSSYHVVALQFHWNNPELRSDYTDSSGLTLYLTPKLRQFNGGHLIVGQQYLEIDPGQKSVVQTGTCTSRCTNGILSQPINVTGGFNHMHYLGVSQHLELYRDGSKFSDIADDDTYNYDSPKVHDHDPPIIMQPGDEIKTTCTYRSISRKNTVYFGQATSDEMCYGFIAFYPAEAARSPTCVNWKNLEWCPMEMRNTQCNFGDILNISHPQTSNVMKKVLSSCNYYGKCRTECPDALVEARKNPCLDGEAGDFVLYQFAQGTGDMLKFAVAMRSCDNEDTPQTAAGNTMTSFAGFVAIAMTLIVFAVSNL